MRLVHVVSRTLYNILIVVESSKQGLYNRFITFLKTRDISNPGQQALFRQIKKSRFSSFLRRRPCRCALGPHFPAPTGLTAPGPLISVQWQLSVLTLSTQGPSSSSPYPHFHRPVRASTYSARQTHPLLLLAHTSSTSPMDLKLEPSSNYFSTLYP